MKQKLLLLLLSTFAVAQEVSVFGAGNLNSNEPYGLTKTEKYILENKNELDLVGNKIHETKTVVDTVNQRLDGLESIYESDSKKLNDSVLKLNELTKKTDINSVEISKIQEIQKNHEDSKINIDKNIESLKVAISKLEKLINEINSNYVSQKELQNNMQQFVTKAEFEKVKNIILKEIGSSLSVDTPPAKVTSKKSKSFRELLTEAKQLYKDDMFTKAIPIFQKLIQNSHKPAESNYYLGEINYYRKNYNDAIKHFKESALLYDKAEYMPKLLLHSAISFEKINDLENASSFYSTLINVYPNSPEAKMANKNLNNLN